MHVQGKYAYSFTRTVFGTLPPLVLRQERLLFGDAVEFLQSAQVKVK
jgi:hypothetical protein